MIGNRNISSKNLLDIKQVQSENVGSGTQGPSENPGNGAGTTEGPSIKNEVNDTLPWAKVMPQFNGDLSKFISMNLIYPEAAKSNGTTGTVFLSFVVDKEGNVSNITPLNPRPIGDGCDEAAIKTAHKMPKWKPGRNEKGEVVSVRYTLPIRFVLK